MRITLIGIPANLQGQVERFVLTSAQPYQNGEPVEFKHQAGTAPDVKVEGAKYIASGRLEGMIRDELPRLVRS